jgi:hypothetical protein
MSPGVPSGTNVHAGCILLACEAVLRVAGSGEVGQGGAVRDAVSTHHVVHLDRNHRSSPILSMSGCALCLCGSRGHVPGSARLYIYPYAHATGPERMVSSKIRIMCTYPTTYAYLFDSIDAYVRPGLGTPVVCQLPLFSWRASDGCSRTEPLSSPAPLELLAPSAPIDRRL